jgi:hypothetical protein
LRSCRRLLAFGIEHDEAAGAIVGGGGGEAGLHQDQMEHTPLSRGHGWKCKGLARGSYPLDGGIGGELEIAVAGSLEAFSVEVDAVVVFGFEAENLGGDVLDGVEKLAIMRQEQGGVGTSQLDFDVGTGRDLWGGGC